MLLAANKVYYARHPNQVTAKPMRLSLLDETTGRLFFLKKESRLGKIVLKRMYNHYDSIILNNNLPISTPSPAEFTLPQLRYKCMPHILREHPGLRYELWKATPPDLILLGSSIFFCAFNREVFFQQYPEKYLLDFTTGNNTPFIASWFMRYADSLGLEFKPGTAVLYGMNRVEMLEDYKGQCSHDYVKEAIKQKHRVRTADNAIEQYLHLPELRYDLTNALKEKYNAWFRRANIYRAALPDQHVADEKALTSYIKATAQPNNKVRTFDGTRVQEILRLADFLQQRGCKLVLVKLPQSLYNDIVLNTEGLSWFDEEMQKLQHDNILYLDASRPEDFGITQLDYLWPGNIFDPEHLNLEGAERFTKALMAGAADIMLRKNPEH